MCKLGYKLDYSRSNILQEHGVIHRQRLYPLGQPKFLKRFNILGRSELPQVPLYLSQALFYYAFIVKENKY